ncbi:haloacid dehalogenase superfamily, subfamily IA, variant 3 with third motif having DD or ED [Clostridium acidisoli DSM 12555]|uniref:Haloacid dehalogenase superfamily, subfamily IA, variant 3 with third motif having DD or ED n=1 Tax=Clostridium acidisoli DSM 12555 TaxID=1121291 RepID=A0A1W1XWJ2_9CLOT|nr:HAD family phosphatase [Clostridium acidisoli]SMC28360.1 haloacid dehalogenase superfamily, subfamily IA, variant 3 with third motif having DD or ED [Clostridium acidisoli DSM 12555]
MLKNISAAIFDMDGTLIDSMWVWDTIDIKYLKKRGFSVPDKLRDDIIHLSFEETALYFKNRFNLSDSIEEIVNEWNDLAYIEYASNVNLKPYAKEYLSKLKAKGIKLAIATSNCTMLLETVLKRHGIYDLFDVITTTDEVNRGKDFPDVYLLSAKKLSVSPSECVVFEDILPAVMGAKAAGMKVVGVHDSYSEYQKKDIMNNADIYINGYREISEAV